MMMNKKQTSKMHLSKYAFIIPAVVIGSLIFGITKATENKSIATAISKNSTINLMDIEQDVASNEYHLSNNKQHEFTKEEKERKATLAPKQDTSIKKEGKKTKVIGVSTIKPDHELSPLIDTLDNGALDIRKLGDYGKGTTAVLLRRDSTKGKPLYILDGKIVPNPLMKLKPEDIESFSILKDKSATALYGQEGANGVVLITTKAKAHSEEATGSNTNKTDTVKSKAMEFRLKGSKSHKVVTITSDNNPQIDGNPLILLDGEKIDKETFDKIDKEHIESVNVWKDEKAIERYGHKGKDGVIEVISKKNPKIQIKGHKN